jgi:hypothetical protein
MRTSERILCVQQPVGEMELVTAGPLIADYHRRLLARRAPSTIDLNFNQAISGKRLWKEAIFLRRVLLPSGITPSARNPFPHPARNWGLWDSSPAGTNSYLPD